MNQDAKQAITGSLGRYEAFINPYKEKEEEALKAKSEVESAKDVMQADREVAKATGVSTLEKARAKGMEEIPFVKETEALVKESATPFVPTKETAGDMAQLFALTNILGFAMGAGGKRNAQAAMAGMNGMLEGYQKGRMDLYKKEKDIFETNMKQLKTRIDLLDRLTKQAKETLQSNFQAGVAELDVAYAQTGADFLKSMQQKLGVARTLEHVSRLKADADKIFNIMERDRIRAEEKAAAERRHREQMAHSEKLAKLRAEGRGAGAGAAAGNIERMMNSMTQVSGAIRAVADLPITTTSPLFGQKEFKGLFVAPLSALNQTMSKETSQMMAGRMIGVARNLASLETGGAATGLVGLTDSIERGISIPAGAKLHVALDRLAEMRRIVDDSARAALASPKYNESQKNLIRENLQIVEAAIPFTLEDVRDATVASKGRSPKVSKQDQNLSFTEYIQKYGIGKKDSESSQSAAPESSGPKEGEKSVSKSGKPIVFRNGNWEYE